MNIIIIIINNALVGLQAKYLPAKGKPGCESCTSDAFKQSLAKYQEKCGRSSKSAHYLGVVANLRQVCWKHHHHHSSLVSHQACGCLFMQSIACLPVLRM